MESDVGIWIIQETRNLWDVEDQEKKEVAVGV